MRHFPLVIRDPGSNELLVQVERLADEQHSVAFGQHYDAARAWELMARGLVTLTESKNETAEK